MKNNYEDMADEFEIDKDDDGVSKELKRKFCKHCKTYFQKANYKIRLKKGKKHYWCLTCKKLTRVPYK